ncbi:MAG TPA: efflux RND transporter periplasmic adaptor subunit [Gammaproteobacteria bacterium]|nr:efflux RND transporter periplasmic adaptor subunit [Gammaproteobacteria bacterium]
MRKQLIIVIVALIVLFGGLFGGKFYAKHRAAAAALHRSFPPIAVSTAVAHTQPWSPEVNVVGSLEAVAGTEITAQIAGNVTEIAFRSGAHVRKGQLLVRLDDSSQRAQLHADQARLTLAQNTLARTRKLYAAHAASQSDLQTAEAAAAAAQAVVEGDQATLSKLHISAPFAGVAGIRAVSLGQYVSPGTAIVDVQSYAPLLLDFSLPQSSVSEIASGQKVVFAVNAYPGKSFEGRVTAIGSQVDPVTRNITLQATLANAHDLLRPGMYGSVQLAVGHELHGVVVPDTAVSYNTFGDYVYVVEPKNGQSVVQQRVVQVEDQRGGLALIASGLKAGEVVVTAGQEKLRDGAAIAVNNSVQP